MKNRFLLCLFIGVLCAGTVRAQSLTPIVVASSGGYFTSGSGSISSTIAEMTMVQTFESAGIFITQGFQQPAESYMSVEEEIAGHFGVYPNPTSGKFTVTVDAAENGYVEIKLYSLHGKVVLAQRISAAAGNHQFVVDISGLDAGVYMLECTHYKSSGQSETGIVKINLTND